jgi:hypothetical protein
MGRKGPHKCAYRTSDAFLPIAQKSASGYTTATSRPPLRADAPLRGGEVRRHLRKVLEQLRTKEESVANLQSILDDDAAMEGAADGAERSPVPRTKAPACDDDISRKKEKEPAQDADISEIFECSICLNNVRPSQERG